MVPLTGSREPSSIPLFALISNFWTGPHEPAQWGWMQRRCSCDGIGRLDIQFVSAELAMEKKMLARVYKIDVTICGHCGVKMQKVCAVIDGDSIRRYLKYLALDPDPPSRSPAKILQPEISFDQDYQGA